jgi:large subunit ribosomal protein L3
MFEELENIELGHKVTADIFKMGDFVAVSGVSKGKGFAGHMKRHGFSGGRRSHGKNSVMRKAGSIGAGSDPSRVWPGTRMAGRMGNENVTVKNLEVTRVEKDKNLVFIKGAVPGAKNGIVFISKI